MFEKLAAWLFFFRQEISQEFARELAKNSPRISQELARN